MIRRILSIITFILLFGVNLVVSQEDSYVVFVKSGCGNCARTINFFNETGLKVKYFNTDTIAVGKKMINKLKRLGYTNDIILPVIILNDTILLHPAQKINQNYEIVSLNYALNMISKKEVDFSNSSLDSNDQCQIKQEIFYLITGTFFFKKRVENKLLELQNSGYLNSGFYKYRLKYVVYFDFFITEKQAFMAKERADKDFSKIKIIKKSN